MNNKINNSVKSLDNQSKEDKEKIAKSKQDQQNEIVLIRNQSKGCRAGLKNPCVFGKHNINFNKNCL